MHAIVHLVLISVCLQGGDFEKAKKEFFDGISKLDPFDVGRASETLVKQDGKEAVNVLLDGYGKLASVLKALWSDKLRYQREMDENSDFEMKDYKTISQSGMVKYKKFKEAESKALDVERKILSLEEVKRSIVKAFGGFTSDAAVAELVAKMDKSPDWARRAGLAEGFGFLQHAQARPALLAQLAADKEAPVKVACLEALKTRNEKGADVVQGASGALAHDFWQVKYAAAMLLRQVGMPEARPAVEALIEALKGADGRLKFDVNGVLVHLTGANRHGNYDAWKSWWDINREAWLAGTYKPTPADAPPEDGGTQASFYGLPVKSKNVIFVVDRSGSMMEPSQWEIEEKRPDTASGGGGKNPPDTGPKKEGDKKVDIARWQLKRCLHFLPDGTEFNIILFNHDLKIMSEKMVKLSSSTRQAAFDFIDRTPAESGTNIYDALEKAFSFAGAGLQDKLVKSSVDTIFLMTDGVPSAGQIQSTMDIAKRIKEMNKLKKVAVNTVGIFTTLGAGSLQANEAQEGTTFLRKLAEENGGVFTDGKKQEGAKGAGQ